MQLKILGVDFSGAKTDDHTWVTSGFLDQGNLVLQDCRPVRRAELAEVLVSLDRGSVAALDFPYSVPKDFAEFWQPGVSSMPDLWAAAATIDLAQFIAYRDNFVALYGETKRRCDLRFPECYSCLHKANPNMVPMTFYGMQMLGPLWGAGCVVPPLEPMDTEEAVLLEAMPGAALKALNLPHKGYKKGRKALSLRRSILDGLEERSGVGIRNLDRFQDVCLGSDDALDSVVAALIATLWTLDPSVFWHPSVKGPEGETDGPDAVALLEGWLYAPVHLSQGVEIPSTPQEGISGHPSVSNSVERVAPDADSTDVFR